MKLEEIHDCEKCHGKIVHIAIDKLGRTYCGYCGERVDYSEWMKQQMEDDVTYCPACRCMTKSIRKGRAHYVCGKCGADKSLSDFYQSELKHE